MEGIYGSPIFSGLVSSEIDLLLENKSRITSYKTGELIATQGSTYHSLLIIDSGSIQAEMTSPRGDSVIIEDITAPNVIAPAILFATDNRLPVTVMATNATDIVSIKMSDFTAIMQSDHRVLQNFMRSISNRSKFLSDKVRQMRFGTIKSKLANYLLEQIQDKNNIEFDIPHTHRELADMFGVTRPALSRAISQIAKEGIISSNKNHFCIKEKSRLKNIIFQK